MACAETFPDWSAAFGACRERDRPLRVTVDGETCKIFPSGRCEVVSAAPPPVDDPMPPFPQEPALGSPAAVKVAAETIARPEKPPNHWEKRDRCGNEVPSAPGPALSGVEVCCATFLAAAQGDTDSEGFGPLVRPWQGEWRAGCEVPALVFCPWCGTKLEPPPADPHPGEVAHG